LTKTGGLDFGRETNSDLKLLIAASDKHGVNYQVLSPEELQVKFPTITLPKDQIAVYSPDSGILNATKCVATLQRLAQCQGCDVRDNMSVVQITNELQIGGETLVRVVTANGEEFYGRNCVITTGAWTKKLVKSVEGIELPLQPLQTTVAYWKVENPEAYSSKRFPVFINYEEPLIYGTPAHEYPNMIKCPAHFGPPCDPDTRDFEPGTDAIAEIVSKFLQETFVGVDTKPSHTESCIYTHSPDNDFIIDRLPSNPNLFVGCGFSGHGFKLAPVVGRILSELVISKAHPYPEVEKHFSLDRFKN
jgi:sarcosine oxidase/L-pipecolate oxidase